MKVVHYGDWKLHREELAKEFEKMMKAACEGQSTDAVWIVGLREQQKFEPVYYLVMEADKLETNPEREQLGPLPWSIQAKESGLEGLEDRKVDRERLAVAMAKTAAKNLEVWEVDDEEKRAVRAKMLKPGLMWAEPVQFNNKRASVHDFGLPNIEILGPLSSPNTLLNGFGLNSQIDNGQGKQIEEVNSCLLRSDLRTSHSPRGPSRSFKPPPPPDKPPSQPPDFTSNFSKLSSIPTGSAFHSTSYPNSTQISGKVDAAGDDPGDFRCCQLCASVASVLGLSHSLEGKADVKGWARAKNDVETQSQQDKVLGGIAVQWIVGEMWNIANLIAWQTSWDNDENTVVPQRGLPCTEQWPTAQQPPPSSLSCLANPDCDRKLIEREHLHLGPPLARYFILPIWPCLLLGFQLDLFLYQDSSLKPPPEPPPHSLIDHVVVHWVFSNIGDCTWQPSGRRVADGDDPGDVLIFPRLMFAFWLALNCSLEDKAYSIGAVMSVDVELKLIGDDIIQTVGKFTIIGQLVYKVDNCLVRHGVGQQMEGNPRVNLMVNLFYHLPQPPELAIYEKVPPNVRTKYKWLIEGTGLQFQAEMELLQITPTDLVYDDFKKIYDLLTHEGNCTLDNLIKLQSFTLPRSTQGELSFK